MDDPDLRGWLDEFDLPDAPGYLLRRNNQRSHEIFVRRVGADITRPQMLILIALAKTSGASQRTLVRQTEIDKSTLKPMLDRMVARGWVRRERDPRDRRAWRMGITPDGEALLAGRVDALAAVREEILAPLAEADRAIFIRWLRVLIGHEGDRG